MVKSRRQVSREEVIRSSLFVGLVFVPSILNFNPLLRSYFIMEVGVLTFLLISAIHYSSCRILLPSSTRAIRFALACLLIFGLFSSMENSWLRPLQVYTVFAITLILLLVHFSYSPDPTKTLRYLCLHICASVWLFLATSLISDGFTLVRYSGFLGNPNNLGWVAGSVCAFLVGVIFSGLTFRILEWLFVVGSFTLSLLLLLSSNSRAAAGGVAVSLILAYLVQLVRSFSKFSRRRNVGGSETGRTWRRYSLPAFTVLSLFFIGALDPLVHKFGTKAASGDVGDGRFESWEVMLKNWTFFGRGEEYAGTMSLELAGHNGYLSQLSMYGLLPMLLFFTIIVMIQSRSLRMWLLGDSLAAPPAVCVGTAFLFMSLFQTQNSAPALWLTLALFGLLLSDSRRHMLKRPNSRDLHSHSNVKLNRAG